MRHILLFEENPDHVSQQVFLLRLIDIQCTVARTIEEVLNWIDAYRMKVISFDLVLLNSLKESGLNNMLLTEIHKGETLPIVCVEDQESPAEFFLDHNVMTCHPDNLMNFLKEQLFSAEFDLPKENTQ